MNQAILKTALLDTPLGPMIVIANKNTLLLLKFLECPNLGREIERLRTDLKAAIIPGQAKPILSIKIELKAYFAGTLQEFKTPLYRVGSPFQKSVWESLMFIPYGQTKSYAEQAKIIGKPMAYRAVANANRTNQFAIVIPCHRIIQSNGDLGGYSGGIARKKWLVEHEKHQTTYR
jgi:AraC family transcriptional regulator, regulatory protein of adaptative response / methylated-DNA-[protein]-cysteine methyltransferase